MRQSKSRNKQESKPKRMTRFDVDVIESIQSHSHLSSADVIRRREILTAEVAAADGELIELAARTADVRSRRAKAEATLSGITQVLLCRS